MNRVARPNFPRAYVPTHHRACANDRFPPDGHSFEYPGSAADKGAIFNLDWGRFHPWISRLQSFSQLQGVKIAVHDRAIPSNAHLTANFDPLLADERAAREAGMIANHQTTTG